MSEPESPCKIAYNQGKKDERERILKMIEDRIGYYAETTGIMERLGCSEGEQVASVALNALRHIEIEIASCIHEWTLLEEDYEAHSI